MILTKAKEKTILDILDNTTTQEKEMKNPIGTVDVQSLFADDVIVYREKPGKSVNLITSNTSQ